VKVLTGLAAVRAAEASGFPETAGETAGMNTDKPRTAAEESIARLTDILNLQSEKLRRRFRVFAKRMTN
jgi:hypothetical protein